MKLSFNLQRLHGSAERSAFSWLFDGWLVAMPKDDHEDADDETRRKKTKAGHYQHVTVEVLQTHVKANTPGASWALENLLRTQSRRRVRVAFYIPYRFKREYKTRFKTLAPKEKFWAEDCKVCGQLMSVVPLPSFLGHTALRDDDLI